MSDDEPRMDLLAAAYITGRLLDDPGVTLAGNGDPRDVTFDVRGIGRVRLTIEYVATAPAAPIPAGTCRMCGKGEADDVGVIIDGVCGDCRAAWS